MYSPCSRWSSGGASRWWDDFHSLPPESRLDHLKHRSRRVNTESEAWHQNRERGTMTVHKNNKLNKFMKSRPWELLQKQPHHVWYEILFAEILHRVKIRLLPVSISTCSISPRNKFRSEPKRISRKNRKNRNIVFPDRLPWKFPFFSLHSASAMIFVSSFVAWKNCALGWIGDEFEFKQGNKFSVKCPSKLFF